MTLHRKQQSQNIPNFIYGTAWKKEATTNLVELALQAGFRAIDTANQAKHYSEILVGEALRQCKIPREQLWLQSKFTSPNGQDNRLPYDLKADITTQVQQSFASSLEHLHTNYLDSYLLHGPYNHPLLGAQDFEVWKALEKLHQSGAAKMIGISNVNLAQLQMLVESAEVKPMFVQNRCYAVRGWDKEVRDFCHQNNIHYQGFSLLTANPQIVQNPIIAALAKKYKTAAEQIIFRFSHQIGIIPLTGTSDFTHMKNDLGIFDFELLKEEVENIFIL
jgi:diketogulonate reductase-like aldo/keto reductase